MRPNSSSQPAPRVGNLTGRGRDIIPDSMGSSQPTPHVGNLSRQRRHVIPNSMGSNQPTSRGGNMNGHRRDIVQPERLCRSVTQLTKSGSSNSAESSCRNSAPPPIARLLRARPAKRLRTSTIQTTLYTEPEIEAEDKGRWNPSAAATIPGRSIRCHIGATKLNRTPNLKERTVLVRIRQYSDVVVCHDCLRHT